jgi:hypothetical protein
MPRGGVGVSQKCPEDGLCRTLVHFSSKKTAANRKEVFQKSLSRIFRTSEGGFLLSGIEFCTHFKNSKLKFEMLKHQAVDDQS